MLFIISSREVHARCHCVSLRLAGESIVVRLAINRVFVS
jgi:hypothetical protein